MATATAESQGKSTATTVPSPSPSPTPAPSPAAPVGDVALLRLMWLASPALPVGGFSYSEGLEAAVEAGLVGGEADATAWLLDQLHLSQARADWAVAAEAYVAWQDDTHAQRLAELNDWVRTTRESQEFRLQTEQMGRSLVEWLRNGPQGDDPRIARLAALGPAPTWPVAFALAGVLAGAPLRQALLALAFGWAENMSQAAMKAVPLGQAAAQRMLAAMADAIPGAVDAALATDASRRQAHTPMLALLSSRHEEQYSRLFRS